MRPGTGDGRLPAGYAVGVMDPIRHIEQLQRYRGRRSREAPIADSIRQLQQAARRREKQTRGAIDAWEATVPAELAGQSRLTAVRGGVWHVTVASASVRFELDRMLRGGLLHDLQTAYKGPLQRVRLTVGVVDPPPNDRP